MARTGLALIVAAVLATGAAEAASKAVDLELALAIDVSGSIDAEEARLQRDGYVRAFRDPEVLSAIAGGFTGRVAVLYFEFSAGGYNKIIADWTEVSDEASAGAFADRLSASPIQTVQRTSISDAIAFAVPQFDINDFSGTRKVIDISGDGPNNAGLPLSVARERALSNGITINGLPIVNNRPGPFGRPPPANLDLYYQDCVIGGRGAFMIVARGFDDFAEAIRRKLLLEISGMPAPPSPLRDAARPGFMLVAEDSPRLACDISDRDFGFIR
jgi:hypothetical protein